MAKYFEPVRTLNLASGLRLWMDEPIASPHHRFLQILASLTNKKAIPKESPLNLPDFLWIRYRAQPITKTVSFRREGQSVFLPVAKVGLLEAPGIVCLCLLR